VSEWWSFVLNEWELDGKQGGELLFCVLIDDGGEGVWLSDVHGVSLLME